MCIYYFISSWDHHLVVPTLGARGHTQPKKMLHAWKSNLRSACIWPFNMQNCLTFDVCVIILSVVAFPGFSLCKNKKKRHTLNLTCCNQFKPWHTNDPMVTSLTDKTSWCLLFSSGSAIYKLYVLKCPFRASVVTLIPSNRMYNCF